MLEQETRVPTPWWVRGLVWLGVPPACAGLMLGLLWVVERLPFGGPVNLIRRLPEPWDVVTALGIGLIIGLILAALIDNESLTVRITPREVVLTRPGHRRTVAKVEIAVAFPDRDQLVLLGRTGRELAREPTLLPAGRLSAAFGAHGVPWAEQDPYLDAYRRWVPGSGELPESAHAVFTARQSALKSGDDEDLRELREELGRLGFVVRDVKKKQYWRRADG